MGVPFLKLWWEYPPPLHPLAGTRFCGNAQTPADSRPPCPSTGNITFCFSPQPPQDAPWLLALGRNAAFLIWGGGWVPLARNTPCRGRAEVRSALRCQRWLAPFSAQSKIQS